MDVAIDEILNKSKHLIDAEASVKVYLIKNFPGLSIHMRK